MEKRQWHAGDVVGPQPLPLRHRQRVAQIGLVADHRPFRRAGGTRGVLQRKDVARRDLRLPLRQIRRRHLRRPGQKIRPTQHSRRRSLCQQDDMTQTGQPVPDFP